MSRRVQMCVVVGVLVVGGSMAMAQEAISGGEQQFLVGPAVDSEESQATVLVGPHQASMMYELQGFDLEGHNVLSTDDYLEFPEEVDFYFAYNADTQVHLRLFQTEGALVTLLADTPFYQVTCEDIADLEMDYDVIDEPLTRRDTMVLLTVDGVYYKIGRAREHQDMSVSFSYQVMHCSE